MRPSGTAITLAEEIIHLSSQKNKWVLRQAIVEKGGNEHLAKRVMKSALRAGGSILPRELDSVKYASDVDQIEIIHTAHNRKGFAAGALMAAEFLYNKKGIFTMKDVLNF